MRVGGLAGRRARHAVALRIARRDAWRHKGRTSIVLAMIGLPVAAAVVLVSLGISSLGTPLSRVEAEAGGAQAVLSDAGCGGCVVWQLPAGDGWGWDSEGESPPTTQAIVSAIGAAPSTVAQLTTAQLDLTAGAVGLGPQVVSALPPAAMAEVYAARTGRLPRADSEVALSRDVAARLDVAPGDTVELEGTELEVVGILDPRGHPVVAALTVPGRLDLQPEGTWFVVGDVPLTWDGVLTLNDMGIRAGSRAVAIDPPADADVPHLAAGGGGGAAPSAATVGIVAAVAAIGLIEAVLLVGPAFAVGARRQTRQLALVSAAGGAPGDVRRIVLATGTVAGLAAGVIGAALGALGFTLLYAWLRTRGPGLPAFVLPWWVIVAGVAFAVLLGLLAAWQPSRSATRRDVVAALAGRRADAAPSRRVPWAGVALGIAGFAAGIVGAVTGRAVVLVSGIVALEIGVVLAAGGLVTLVGAAAPHAGVALRFALRDAVRQRSRTTPAVASIIAAVAAAVAVGVYTDTSGRLSDVVWQQTLGTGSIIVQAVSPEGVGPTAVHPEAVPGVLAAAERDVAAVVPVTGRAIVHLLGDSDAAAEFGPTAWAELRPELQCPATAIGTAEAYDDYVDDWRCQGRSGMSSPWWSDGLDATLVDDGTTLTQLGLGPAGVAAAQALARGEIVVGGEGFVWDDGTAHVSVTIADAQAPDGVRTLLLVARAHVQSWSSSALVLPTSLVQATDGLAAVPAGGVIQTSEPYEQTWVDEVSHVVPGGSISVQTPPSSSRAVVLLVVLSVVSAVALSATWLSVGLAAAETRPDLATLSAVGATGGMRRRIAAAQALVLAALGTWVGVALGLALGWVLAWFTLSTSHQANELRLVGWDAPGVSVPWWIVAILAVGLPAVAVAGAWLTAPRRLPLVRRTE